MVASFIASGANGLVVNGHPIFLLSCFGLTFGGYFNQIRIHHIYPCLAIANWAYFFRAVYLNDLALVLLESSPLL